MQRSEGEGPSSMSGSCGSCVDGVLYLFGGHQSRGNTNLVSLPPEARLRISGELQKDTAVGFVVSAGVPSAAESVCAPLGEDERADGSGADLQRQAGLLGLQKPVRLPQAASDSDPVAFLLMFVVCFRRLVYFGGYGYIAQPGHRGTFALDENSFMVSASLLIARPARVTRL